MIEPIAATIRRYFVRRKLAASFSLALLLFPVLLACGYWSNNAAAPPPARSEIETSRARAMNWLRDHETEVLDTENPALWWMLHESAALSGDRFLTDLCSRYYDRYLAHNARNVWHHLFDANSAVQVSSAELAHFPDYGLLFLYGLSCQSALRTDSQVRRLLDSNACDGPPAIGYFRDPTCTTHQLMGVRFAQRRGCEDAPRLNALVETLQDRLASESAWDFRVVDFYLQRVLLLAESGAGERVRARWLRRILDAQRADGGWDDFHPILSVGATRALGWSGRGIRVRSANSNFHTTAQGLFLMTLLLTPGSRAIPLPAFKAGTP